ncbi:HRDC domain-containing protein [Lentisphaerota bacterium ZTH]|nr:HRDC domain-containing protein [Lentisphaerota bacterium]WET06609.1 HRDC domain-containing protein [Lentisphaerota bacterium ZTH]
MYISTEAELKELVARASGEAAVALDTEFVWERTFYPNLGLVQLAVGRDCFLIDPLAVKDLSALGDLIANPDVTKILHDACQDLTILKQATGASPVNVFDTRLGYGFCSPTSILSLAALLEQTIGVSLPKTETRANWLQRPLSQKMLEYANDDVKYLTEVMKLIIRRAKSQKTDSWLLEEMKYYDNPALYEEVEPEEYFRRIKGVNLIKGQKLAVLQELACWREKKARAMNRPRSHIVHNNVLVDLTYKCPRQRNDLKNVNRLSPNAVKRYGSELLQCIEKGLNRPEAEIPAPELRPPRKPAKDLIMRLIAEKAEKLNIDPVLIGSSREVNLQLVTKSPDSRFFKGWRKEFMQDIFNQDNIGDLLGLSN